MSGYGFKSLMAVPSKSGVRVPVDTVGRETDSGTLRSFERSSGTSAGI